jgi:hypothetical protein
VKAIFDWILGAFNSIFYLFLQVSCLGNELLDLIRREKFCNDENGSSQRQ